MTASFAFVNRNDLPETEVRSLAKTISSKELIASMKLKLKNKIDFQNANLVDHGDISLIEREMAEWKPTISRVNEEVLYPHEFKS